MAVKGLGGYHLACRADDERRGRRAAGAQAPRGQAVRADGRRTWRRRGRSCELRAAEEELLLVAGAADRAGPRRARRAASPPRSRRARRELGVMLPYTPLHHLLLRRRRRAAGDDQRQRLRRADRLPRRGRARAPGRIADLFLVHDRPIQTRTDDSVVRVVGGRPQLLRRSRGYVPRAACRCRSPRRAAARLRRRAEEHVLRRPQGDRAWVGHHIGDLENDETLRLLRRGRRALRAAVRRRAGGRRARPAPRLPVDRRTRSSARASSSSASSTTTPTSPPAWPSTARPGPPSARSSTAPATAPTARSGAASCCSATCAASSASAHLRAGAPARRRRGRSASRGGWRARGSPRRTASRRRCRRRCAGRSTRAGWAQVARLAAQRAWPRR